LVEITASMRGVDGVKVVNRIYLDPAVLAALFSYVEKLTKL
jgi:hypothetical protein